MIPPASQFLQSRCTSGERAFCTLTISAVRRRFLWRNVQTSGGRHYRDLRPHYSQFSATESTITLVQYRRWLLLR